MKIELTERDETRYPALASCAGSPHSWPEDYADENGKYLSKCLTCNTTFMGHKRRLACKICDAENQKWWDSLTDDEKKEHIATVAAYARDLIWANEA